MSPILEINDELKRTPMNLNSMSSFQLVPVRCLNNPRNRTRMTRIARIFTDLSASKQSVFTHNPNLS
jgi:hypothetical protein